MRPWSRQASATHISVLADENKSLSRSHSMMDEYLAQGQTMLDSIVSQGDRLKAVHMKVLDITSSLGISRNLISVIGRRGAIDRAIVYGGMLIVLFVL